MFHVIYTHCTIRVFYSRILSMAIVFHFSHFFESTAPISFIHEIKQKIEAAKKFILYR